MSSEQIGEYEIEYSGARLPDTEDWAAYVTIYGPSSNPMHRNNIFPAQRVSVETVFPSEKEAEAEARKVAMSMVDHHHGARRDAAK
jgi:hypothetical protein